MSTATMNVAAATQDAVDSAFAFANVVLGGADQLLALNVEVARKGIDYAFGHVADLMQAEDFATVVTFQAKLPQPMVLEATNSVGGFFKLATEAQREFQTLGRAEMERATRNMVEGIETLGKFVPHGSDHLLSMARSAAAAATATYDAFTGAGPWVAASETSQSEAASPKGKANAVQKARKAA